MLTPAVIRAYDDRAPSTDDTETATFGLGCFWGPDAQFGATTGVVRTRVGYAGGTRSDPTYRALGDHTEVVQVDYDPTVVSYADLLGRAVRSHDPRSQPRKTQYQHLVLIATPAQRETVERVLADHDLPTTAVETRVERLDRFYPAEDYHQKYSLRSTPSLLDPLEEAGYGGETLRESPAAATLNAVAAGHDPPDGDDLPVGGRTRDR